MKAGIGIYASLLGCVICLGGCQTAGPSCSNESLCTRDAWSQMEQKERDQKAWRDNPFSKIIKVNGDPILAPKDPEHERREVTQSLRDSGKPREAYAVLMKRVAHDIAARLPVSPQIAAAQNKHVLVLSDISPRSNAARDLRVAMDELRVELINNKELSDSFVFLLQGERAGEEALRRAGAHEAYETADPTTGVTMPRMVRYQPQTIYTLSGTVDVVEDPANHSVRFVMFPNIIKPTDGQPTYLQEICVEYRFHPYRKTWITREEDEGLCSIAR